MSIQTVRLLPTKLSSDNEWLSWYKDLRKSVGTAKANRLFAMQWNAQDGYNSSANTNNFREEMKGYGIEVGTNALGELTDFGSKSLDYFGDFFTTGKWLGLGLLTITVVSIGGLIYQIAFSSKVRGEAVGIGTTIATKGLK